jgi:hypothetical protein
MGLRILPQDEYDNTQSVMDNGLQTANVQLFDIRFDQGKNLLRGYSGSTYAVIPYGVTHIDSNSGLQNKGLTSVKIPSSVTIIGDFAFYYNLLTSVTIPDSVTSIGSVAFAQNPLTSVFIGNSVASIDRRAFADNDLKSITIGMNVNTSNDSNQEYYYSFSKNFDSTYRDNNRKAGMYTYQESGWSGTWTYSARR